MAAPEPGCGYLPWVDVTETPLPIRECWHYFDGNGFCENGMSPHAGQPCPWAGRPEQGGSEEAASA